MKRIGIIGAGPAGLMSADVLSRAGHQVLVFDAMPTVARKFLMAGKSGLNITHGEPHEALLGRYRALAAQLRRAVDDFPATAIRAFMSDLGIESFIGSSGRVFPVGMKASPLLRAWLARLTARGVEIHTRWAWLGGSGWRFSTPDGDVEIALDRVILALGGASWPRLGSNAGWVSWLQTRGIAINPFQPSNCGFDVEWSEHFRERFAGQALKPVGLLGHVGECVITASGLEGGVIYTASAALREDITRSGAAVVRLDLAPGRDETLLAGALDQQDRKQSLSNRLRKRAGLPPVKAALLREADPDIGKLSAGSLAHLIKSCPVKLLRPRPIEEAISSAGGVAWSEIGDDYQLLNWRGVFVAGEMIDWEAPTGGYLLTACLATGRAAAKGVLDSLG